MNLLEKISPVSWLSTVLFHHENQLWEWPTRNTIKHSKKSWTSTLRHNKRNKILSYWSHIIYLYRIVYRYSILEGYIIRNSEELKTNLIHPRAAKQARWTTKTPNWHSLGFHKYSHLCPSAHHTICTWRCCGRAWDEISSLKNEQLRPPENSGARMPYRLPTRFFLGGLR